MGGGFFIAHQLYFRSGLRAAGEVDIQIGILVQQGEVKNRLHDEGMNSQC